MFSRVWRARTGTLNRDCPDDHVVGAIALVEFLGGDIAGREAVQMRYSRKNIAVRAHRDVTCGEELAQELRCRLAGEVPVLPPGVDAFEPPDLTDAVRSQ